MLDSKRCSQQLSSQGLPLPTSHTWFSIPTARVLSSNVANSRTWSFRCERNTARKPARANMLGEARDHGTGIHRYVDRPLSKPPCTPSYPGGLTENTYRYLATGTTCDLDRQHLVFGNTSLERPGNDSLTQSAP